MSKSKSGSTYDGVARDYNEFCAQWESRIERIVMASKFFPPPDVADIVQELMMDFYVQDGLHKYDPTRGAKFSSWVYGFVSKRLLGKRDRAARLAWRESVSLYAELEKETEEFFDILEAPEYDISIEFIDMVTSVYRQLKALPVTSAINDFPKLFSCIVQQTVYGMSPLCIEAIGEQQAAKMGRHGVNRKALAYELNVSESTISVMLNKLATIPVVVDLLGR